MLQGAELQARLRTRIPGIEMLRAVAVILVLLQNRTSPVFETGGLFARAWSLLSGTGWSGVQLFFVISGFLITGILLDKAGQPGVLKNFYMRRLLRIFPIYFAFLAFFYLLLPALDAFPGWLEPSRQHQIWFWTYLVNWTQPYVQGLRFGHLWSLAIEEQFYLLWPWPVLFLAPRRLMVVCLLLILSAPLVRLGLWWIDPHWQQSAYTFTPARWDALALGALLACLLRDEALAERLRPWAAPVFLGLLALILGQLLWFHEFRPAAGPLGLLNQTTAAVLSAAALLLSLSLSRPEGRGWKARIGQGLMTVGKYSYALYLVHMPIKMWWTQSRLALTPADFPAAVGEMAALLGNFLVVFTLSLALSWLTWRLVEQPFLRLKRHFD
jgi:peptidoglycan/LPS O-acetylase OafA/YrhL